MKETLELDKIQFYISVGPLVSGVQVGTILYITNELRIVPRETLFSEVTQFQFKKYELVTGEGSLTVRQTFRYYSGFWKIIAKSPKTEFLPTLNQLLAEATRKFYDEFDYYPNLAVCAPGTFNIAGEYMELAGGLLIQAALPLMTVIVTKWHRSLKCRILTSYKDADEPNRVILPVARCRSFQKGFPKWANLLKGVMNNFIRKNKKGFDALIHSSIPVCCGLGSSAALATAFHALLLHMSDEDADIRTISNARKCKIADEKFGESTSGSHSNYTTFFADTRGAVVLNSRGGSPDVFSFRDPNILFLLTIPTTDLLQHPKDLIRIRNTELKLIAKLLDLDDISEAGECHLQVLASMDDPSREKVTAILREFESDENYIVHFVKEFFTVPKLDEKISERSGEDANVIADSEEETEDSNEDVVFAGESLPKFEYKVVCDEVICLGGVSQLSVRSDLSVISKLTRRLRYIVSENKRVRSFIKYVTELDFVSAGVELTRSHLSLKVDFEVSSSLMDILVQFMASLGGGVFGSKMMRNGGIVTLIHRNDALATIDSIEERFGKGFRFYLVFPSEGVRKMDLIPPSVPRTCLSETYPTIGDLVKSGVENFEATYQRYPTHGHYSPGCIKVLGDYCDYNQSYCLSMALNMVTLIVGALNGSGKIRVATTAKLHPQKVMFQVPSLKPLEPGNVIWANYIRGVISYFKGSIPGFDCLIETNIPLGGQVLSNASVQVAMYSFLENLTGNRTEDEMEKASRCMKAEHDFTNTLCGIDDFVVALRGLENQMILLDSKKTTFTYLPLFDPGLVFLLVYNIHCSKPNKSAAYLRMEECYDVAKALGLSSLRCAKEEDLKGLEGVPEIAIKRAKYVISEGRRVLAGAEALKNCEAQKFGRLMVESHISLRDDFEISTRTIDAVVERAMEVEGVLGARMTGMEYGHSVLVFVKQWAVDDVIDHIRNANEGEWKYYLLTPSGGSEAVDVKGYIDSRPGPEKTFEKIFEA